MDAYVYKAALLCADCAQARIIQVEEMAVKPRGYPSDSDAYPQGPYPQGGGEADSPQHCDDCSLFLENPLTGDGMEYIANNIIGHFRDREDGKAEVLQLWAKEYNIPWYEPGESDIESLRFEHSMSDDDMDSTVQMMFNVCGELHERTFKDRKNALRATVFLEAYEYKPGVNPCDPDSGPVVFALAAVSDEDLLTFAREIADEYDSKKKAKEDEEESE